MTPQKKANELINRFTDVEDGEMYIGKAKQCALITADEMIEAFWKTHVNEKEFRFWGKVKQEIKKL